MYFVHKDKNYRNDKWYKSFKKVLKKKKKKFQIFNLYKFNSFGKVPKNSYLIGRFGHLKKDKKRFKSKLNDVYTTWNKIFPSSKSYFFYDDKWSEYKFLNKNNLGTVPTNLVETKRGLMNFLSSKEIDFPIVIKDREGAGGNNVYKAESPLDVDFENLPFLAQPYISVSYDFRVLFLNNKIFCLKRYHSKSDFFPYKWYNVKVEPINILEYFSKNYIKKLYNIFVRKLNSPTMALDIVFDGSDPKILEFSYCFSIRQHFQCKFYHKIPSFEKVSFEEKDNWFIDNLVAIEVLNWINS